jgi:putative SOS response-associated peptidase YedK
MMRWGLVPSWSKDPKAGAPLINARAETVATKPAFRTAFKRRRCLIPADGFYEWQKTDGKTNQPFYIRMKQEHPFAFAGLWESSEGPDASGARVVYDGSGVASWTKVVVWYASSATHPAEQRRRFPVSDRRPPEAPGHHAG